MNTHDNNESKPHFTEILVCIVIQNTILSLILLLILQYIIVEVQEEPKHNVKAKTLNK